MINFKKIQFEANISYLAWGFCVACSVAFCKHAPCMFGKQGLQIPLEIFFAHLEVRELSFLWRLCVEGVRWIVLLGVEPHLDSC